MNKQQNAACQTPSTECSQGLTAAEALEFHRGWAAARSLEPYDVSQGSMWIEGFLTYQWLKDQPERSWKRH